MSLSARARARPGILDVDAGRVAADVEAHAREGRPPRATVHVLEVDGAQVAQGLGGQREFLGGAHGANPGARDVPAYARETVTPPLAAMMAPAVTMRGECRSHRRSRNRERNLDRVLFK